VPGRKQLAERRIGVFKQKMKDVLAGDEELEFFRQLIRDFATENACSTEDAAAALAFQLQRERPLQPPPDRRAPLRPAPRGTGQVHPAPRSGRGGPPSRRRPDASQFDRYRIQVGRSDGVTASHIVGAIAGEGGFAGSDIGKIKVQDRFSTVELPVGVSEDVVRHLRTVRIFQRPLALERDGARELGGRVERPRRDGTKAFSKTRKVDGTVRVRDKRDKTKRTKKVGAKGKPWDKMKRKTVGKAERRGAKVAPGARTSKTPEPKGE
jgi:ATP-dependent RNA helicase DeaD